MVVLNETDMNGLYTSFPDYSWLVFILAISVCALVLSIIIKVFSDDVKEEKDI